VKKIITVFALLVLLLGALLPLAAEDGFNLDIGRYYMSVTPKVLNDGVQTDYSFGFFYKEAGKIAGEIRFRHIKGSDNDEVWDISDSLLARDRTVYELFFLPLNWHFFRKSGFNLRAGLGGYYDYNSLAEKGYFNDSSLYEPAGPDTYNAYINKFTGHALGPLLDVGLSWKKGFFYSELSFGIVPVLYLIRNQTWMLKPYMTPASYSVSGNSVCGPYYYLTLDMAFNFKYISVFFTLLNEYSVLKYTTAGFTETGAWGEVSEKSKNKVLAVELSILLNLGLGGFKPQIGYGRTFDEASGGSNYLLLGVKKQWL